MNIESLKIRSIITGWLFDVIGSTAFVITAPSINLIISSLLFDLLLTLLGGYLTASIANSSELKNAFLMGLLSEFASLVLLFVVKPNSVPFWYHLISLLLTIPLALLGGYMYLKFEQGVNRNKNYN